ncbi:hypothetical protein [Pseudorhodoplanes sinuspersici]|uniref:Uncharacterized protein n=1 Tax=Pseudorhodoplanes sinuspersici TaxID=1235591 RepID=A0A1W6ZLF6_9HYPH|nr:hypothetical protein [Pseudorhodoplanes sinuspersici]ARP98248.1 hypothetical protein CAK95_03440 [Pseudorhodoplanes sinuspersici]ARP98263.1 hypothetical protein CAK95_03515 [Pseudorhodoplanes sinuspersici]
MSCGDASCNFDWEAKMVVVVSDEAGPKVWCYPHNIKTVWSCCGHNRRPGVIGLADGRELIIAADAAETR